MSTDAYIALGVAAIAMVAMVAELAATEVVLMGAVTVLLATGVLEPAEAAAGFGSVTVITIASLFIIGEGVRRTGLLLYLADSVLGKRARREPLMRMMGPTAALSAFLNNTLVVAIAVPAVIEWCKRTNQAPSRMLMPMSYAAILGGTCTLIGTSTNLVVDGFMADLSLANLGMFELAMVGVPLTAAGLFGMWIMAPRALPDRRDPVSAIREEQREFLAEMLVDNASRLDGVTVADAGLRNLPGLFLVNLERDGEFTGAVAPDQKLRGGDRLVFAGVASSVVELRVFPGLSPAPETHYDPLAVGRRDRLYEVVVSASSPLVGTTIKDIGFRSRYSAAVLAVHRAGRRVDQKLGEVALRVGDTLMLEAESSFGSRWGDSGDFALVSRVRAEPRPKLERAPHAAVIVVAMVAIAATGVLPIMTAAMLATGAMFGARVLTPSEAARAVRLRVLITIAAALALGHALESSGAAKGAAGWVLDIAGGLGPRGLLAVTLVLAVGLSSIVTNVAAAAIALPIAVDAALLAGLDPRPFAIAVAVGASASFLTPFGYQTNLMVYGPGGYRFSDFARLGVPLTAIVVTISAIAIPVFWPLQ